MNTKPVLRRERPMNAEERAYVEDDLGGDAEERADARKALANGNVIDEYYEIREAKNGQFYFVLKAANHQIIGTSEMYATRHNAEEGIESVMRYAPTAPIVRE